jgi:ABC-2 type transport system ATP-binding protein
LPALRAMTVQSTAPQFEDAYLAAIRKQNAASGIATSLPKPTTDKAPMSRSFATDAPVIETKDLSKRFGAFTAVDRFTFAVRPGEIFGLLGPNGAGKSTTFKMLCGLIAPTSGQALVAGFDLATARADARSRIGYMAQKFAYVGHLTVAQNIAFAGGVYGLSGAELARRIDDVVAEFSLTPYLDQNCGDLPLGIKQRMALACAILHKPAILFLDEPTSGVDPVTRREFWSRLNAMADDGTTILVTSHFLDEAEYCDRMVIIYRGRQIAAGSPEEIKAGVTTSEPTLEEAFIHLIEQYDRQSPDMRASAA